MYLLISNFDQFFFRTSNNYYPEVFIEECKYVLKEKNISKYITDNIEISSDSYEENSDEENSNEKYFEEENLDEEN